MKNRTYDVYHLKVRGKLHISSALEDLIEEESFYLTEERGIPSSDITVTVETKTLP